MDEGNNMKLLHTADLHIGKTIYEFSMLEDQKYILEEILQIAREEQINGFLLAGDIYDRSVPSTEAVQLLEWFLLKALAIAPVFMIAGNHDSAERLSFGASLLEKSGLYIAGGKEVKEVLVEDAFGKVAIHLLPFVKPAVVGAGNGEEAVDNQLKLLKAGWKAADRHVLLSHFFVCARGKEPELSDSEVHSFVGGLEQVDVSLFEDYDYVALGHIHKPQCMKRGQTYYAGSPLCYSFSEAATDKGVNIIEVSQAGDVRIDHKILHPLHRMRIIKGSLSELMSQGNESESGREDYIQAILTDRDELIDPIGSLRSVYPNTMQIVLEKRLAEGNVLAFHGAECNQRTMEELFESFYESLTGEPLDAERLAVVQQVAAEVEGV